MDKEQKERKEFLQQQFEWTKEQMEFLNQMDIKLHEMKKIAEYAAKNDLSLSERKILKSRLEILKKEYGILETQRSTILH